MRINDLYRTDVIGPKGKRIGRVGEALFHPSKCRVIGYIVERPRLLFLYDRKDRYVAADRVSVSRDQVVVGRGVDAWDSVAAGRLGIDWEKTVVWSKMPVRTEGGVLVGSVGDVLFDTQTLQVSELDLSAGTAADAAVGVRRIPAEMVRGYRDGAIVVADEAAALDTSGGAAAVAGKTAAAVSEQTRQAAAAAAKGVEKAARYTGAAARVAVRSKTGKKTIGWLKSMKDEIVDAMGDPDDDE